MSTGLRKSELLGLRWRDIDLNLESPSLSVTRSLYKRRGIIEFKEPKTAHSSRRVALTSKLAQYLREYRKDRTWLGQPVGLVDLVFSNDQGRPRDPSVLTHQFHKIAAGVGLGNVQFHDLRYTFASLALLQGAPIKVISEALGHASAAFTMDVYSHIIKGMQEDMMALLDEVIPSGLRTTSRFDVKS